jgi:hypothetical protein
MTKRIPIKQSSDYKARSMPVNLSILSRRTLGRIKYRKKN